METNLITVVVGMSCSLVAAGQIVGSYAGWVARLAGFSDGWDVAMLAAPLASVGIMFGLGLAAPSDYNGNPERLAVAAHALQIGGMWAGAEGSAIGRAGSSPYVRGAAAEDIARERAEQWTGAGLDALASLND